MKKYSDDLLVKIKQRQVVEDYYGMPLIVKRVPDSDVDGIMDPRLYKDSEKMMKMLKWLPSFMLKMDTSEKGIANLRETFNGIKSVECVDRHIYIEDVKVKGSDGYEIPLRIYKSDTPIASGHILYYIHGGGFFAGHHGVVEESLKMLVAKSDIIVFSVDYRLAYENPYPIGHNDCYEALNWIYDNAEKFGGNKDKIFVAGDSAGGNLTQYCTTRSYEDNKKMVCGQLLLYPTLNMAKVNDEYYHPSIDQFAMAKDQKRALTKMINMFGKMSDGLEPILKVKDVNNDYLNPYTRDPKLNPPTFVTAGQHDFLELETFGYAVKLYKANVDVTAIVYNGLGHAFFDNTGVYPQCEDCIEEMINFILKH